MLHKKVLISMHRPQLVLLTKIPIQITDTLEDLNVQILDRLFYTSLIANYQKFLTTS